MLPIHIAYTTVYFSRVLNTEKAPALFISRDRQRHQSSSPPLIVHKLQLRKNKAIGFYLRNAQ